MCWHVYPCRPNRKKEAHGKLCYPFMSLSCPILRKSKGAVHNTQYYMYPIRGQRVGVAWGLYISTYRPCHFSHTINCSYVYSFSRSQTQKGSSIEFSLSRKRKAIERWRITAQQPAWTSSWPSSCLLWVSFSSLVARYVILNILISTTTFHVIFPL